MPSVIQHCLLQTRTNAGRCRVHVLTPCKTRCFFWVSVIIQAGSKVNFGQIIKYNNLLKRMIINLLPWSYISLYELILTSNLVKFEEKIFRGRFSSVLIKYIGLWLEYCRSFCTFYFITQGNNNPDKVHIFFDRKYRDCFSLLYEESSWKKIVPEDCTFLFQFHFELTFNP